MSAGEVLINVCFYVFALAALAGAVAVASSRNIVRSAFALLVVLFSAASFYAFLRADFVVVAQIIIYVGGILVLIIFAIMLTHRITDVKLSNESSPGPASFFACACMLFALVVVVLTHGWGRDVKPAEVLIPASKTTQDRSVTLGVGLLQVDGKTAVTAGSLLLEGRGTLTVEARDLPVNVIAARVRLQRQEKSGGAWKDSDFQEKGRSVRTRDMGLGGAGSRKSGRLDLVDLEPGRYRAAVSLVAEGLKPEDPPQETDAFAIRIHSQTDDCDFTAEKGLTHPIGMALMGPYLLPFEVVSMLLLAALIGAAFLARKEVKS